MGAVTVNGNTGNLSNPSYAYVSISDALIATRLQNDGFSFADIYYEDSPITSFTGAALRVSTSGNTGGDAYLELDDTRVGATTLTTGKLGGAYATFVESDVVSSLTFKTIAYRDYEDDTFTLSGAAINITSQSGDPPSDIWPGQSYIQYLDYIYSDQIQINQSFAGAWNNLTDQQKSFTFLSDLFLSTSNQKGDLGSYFNQNYDQDGNQASDLYALSIEGDNQERIGAFLVLADSTSGAITSTANGGSNIVVLHSSLAVGQVKGDVWLSYDQFDYDVSYAIDSLTGAAVRVTGDGAYFSATAGSALGALTVNGKLDDVIINIVDSDVITRAVESDYIGQSLGFANWDYHGDLFGDIAGASITATTKGFVEFNLDYGVAGAVNLTGGSVTADFYNADIATSLKYKEVGNAKVAGDTFTFTGAATRVTATGTAENTYAYLESTYSGHGAISVTAAKGYAGASLEGSIVATNAVIDYKYYSIQRDMSGEEIGRTLLTTVPSNDAEWWKWDAHNYRYNFVSEEQIKTLTGAAVNINGGLGADLGLYNSIVGNVTLNAGLGAVTIEVDNTFISSRIATNINGSYSFGAGILKVSGQTADVALHNVYLSTLDLTAVKGSSNIELKYNDNTLLNDYGFSVNPNKFDIKLKVNGVVDNINIDSEYDSNVLASISGFEWGLDTINGYRGYMNDPNDNVYQLLGVSNTILIDFA
jgi:hypothetical protein